eukprot:scaffold7119_cov119-Skeletonema_marinoi.AAC.4
MRRRQIKGNVLRLQDSYYLNPNHVAGRNNSNPSVGASDANDRARVAALKLQAIVKGGKKGKTAL